MIALWLIIAILILGVLIFLKIEHHGRTVIFVIILLAIIFLYFSATSVISSEEFDLSSPKEIVRAAGMYFSWLWNSVSGLWEIGEDTTGRVVETINFTDTAKNRPPR